MFPLFLIAFCWLAVSVFLLNMMVDDPDYRGKSRKTRLLVMAQMFFWPLMILWEGLVKIGKWLARIALRVIKVAEFAFKKDLNGDTKIG